jgi:putative oxidoreductase
MTDVAASRLIVPVLGTVYRALAPFTEPLIRLVAGLSFIPHGYPKLLNPPAAAKFFTENGFEPGMLWALAVGCTEVFGGLCLALGFLTRLACVPTLLFLLSAIRFHWPNGFPWNEEGFEYPLFWAVVVFHFLIHGGGRYSVDALIRREI